VKERLRAVEQLLLDVRRRLAEEGHQPRPVQRPVPVLVGAMSASGLAVAARHADIVGFAGLRQLPGAPPGTFTVASLGLTAGQLLDSPFVLLATDAGAATDELRRRRERYGFTSVTVHQPYLSALGEVIEGYRASATG
jgi:hypothetical protein